MGLGRQATAPEGRCRPSGWRSGGGGGGGGGSTAWVASLPSAEVYHHSSACFPPHPCFILRSLARALPQIFKRVVRNCASRHEARAQCVACSSWSCSWKFPGTRTSTRQGRLVSSASQGRQMPCCRTSRDIGGSHTRDAVLPNSTCPEAYASLANGMCVTHLRRGCPAADIAEAAFIGRINVKTGTEIH